MKETSRRLVIAGNWKMYKTVAEALALVNALKHEVEGVLEHVEIVVCPPFTALYAVSTILQDGDIALGAQNVHWEKDGAFTGEISAPMLKELGIRYAIVGHSERRQRVRGRDVAASRGEYDAGGGAGADRR